MKKIIKDFLIYGLAQIPLEKGNNVFVTILSRENSSGPGRFLFNLERGLGQYNYRLERFFLSKCRSALIISNSPGDRFFNMCQNKKIKTVLRVDGFYYSKILNRIKFSNRTEIISKVSITQRLQRDLILSDWVVYQSHFSKIMADDYLYMRDRDYSIIYNGVDLNHFRPSLGIGRDVHKPTLMVLGNLRDDSLLILNLEVFRKVREAMDCKLHIVGHMTDTVRRVLYRWMDNNDCLRRDIIIFGKVDFADLPRVISSADIALHLKAGDWCPNAVLETMACGVPVLCQKYGGTAELVYNSDLIIDYNSYFSYDDNLVSLAAQRVLFIYDNLTYYKYIARKRAEDFSLDNMVLNYLKIL